MIKEINTEGIIIGSSKHGENGRLLNFITKDNGMISVVKHGFTSKKNIGRSILQPIHFIKLELVHERKKYKINDFELLDNYLNIRDSYDKTNVILNIFAVLNKLPLNDIDGNSMIFHLVKKLLETSDNENELPSNNTEIYFYYQLAWCLGIKFNISGNCSICNSKDKLLYLDTANGNLLCNKCKGTSEYHYPVSEKLSNFLISISKIKFDELHKIKPQSELVKKEFINMFNIYTNFHINHKIV